MWPRPEGFPEPAPLFTDPVAAAAVLALCCAAALCFGSMLLGSVRDWWRHG